MRGNPGVDLSAVDAAGRAHVGNHTEELARFQQAQSFDAGLGADHGIAAAFERGADASHNGRLVLDQQDRQVGALNGWVAHG